MGNPPANDDSEPTSPSDFLPSLDTAEADLITGSLIESRTQNARFMNGVRFFAGSAFHLVYLAAFLRQTSDLVLQTWPHLLLYWFIATLIWYLAPKSKQVGRLSRFAVPLLDMPMVTWIQFINVNYALNSANADSGQVSAIAVFTLALLVFLTAMSSLSLRTRYLIPTTLVGGVCVFLIYRQANLIPEGNYFSLALAFLLLIATAAMMSWMPRRQAALIREAANRQARRNRLARYFSPGVAHFIEDRDDPEAGEECEISVLFCDIRGFTGLSEGLTASEVVDLLNDFHGCMVEEIFRFGGTLDKFLGDGLLAWFNAPVRQPDHVVLAVKCALSMIESLDRLNLQREAEGKPPLQVGIGIHCGLAVVGNIGARHRKEFTAVGDTVNVASRLESLSRNHDTSIIVSDSVFQKTGTPEDHGLAFHSCGSAEVRGRQQPVTIYAPASIGEPDDPPKSPTPETS